MSIRPTTPPAPQEAAGRQPIARWPQQRSRVAAAGGAGRVALGRVAVLRRHRPAGRGGAEADLGRRQREARRQAEAGDDQAEEGQHPPLADGEPQRPGALEVGRVEVERQQLVRLALAPVGRLGEGPGRRGRAGGITRAPLFALAAAVALTRAIARGVPGAFPVGSSAAALARAAARRASRGLPVRSAAAATALGGPIPARAAPGADAGVIGPPRAASPRPPSRSAASAPA